MESSNRYQLQQCCLLQSPLLFACSLPNHSSHQNPPDPPVEELPPKLQEIVKLFQSVQEPKAKYQQLLFYSKNLKPLETQFNLIPFRNCLVLPDSYLDMPNKDYGGDLFVDGKFIHWPQYRFGDRQTNTRNRPRARYDSRRESMPVERREPQQRQSWDQGQGTARVQQQPPSMGNQFSGQRQGTGFSMNQGQFNQNCY